MKKTAPFLFGVFATFGAVACASPNSNLGPKPAPAPAPARVGAVVPPASVAPPPAAPECLAEVTTKEFGDRVKKKLPAGWTDAGRLTVTGVGDHPHAELRDASGALVAFDVDMSNEKAFMESVRRSACRVGGLLLVPEVVNEPTARLRILKPVAQDENADLKTICAPLPRDGHDALSGADPLQKLAIARQEYGQRLTSTKWRRWLASLNAEAKTAPDLGAVYAKKAKDVDAPPAAGKTCWFVKTAQAASK